MRRSLVMYDFATAPFWISLYIYEESLIFFFISERIWPPCPQAALQLFMQLRLPLQFIYRYIKWKKHCHPFVLRSASVDNTGQCITVEWDTIQICYMFSKVFYAWRLSFFILFLWKKHRDFTVVYCFYSPFRYLSITVFTVYYREDAVNAHPNTFFLIVLIYR